MANLFCDVSVYQRDDLGFFQDMKAHGVQGVVIKVTEGSAAGTGYVNPKAYNQVANALNAGLKVSLYHFARYINDWDARQEAQFFAEHTNYLKQALGDFSPVMVSDIEVQTGANLNTATHAFLDELRNNGFNKLGVYTMTSYFTSGFMNSHYFDDLGAHIWVAGYGVQSLGIDNASAWQFSNGEMQYGNETYYGVDTSYDYDGWFTENKNAAQTNQNNQASDNSGWVPEQAHYQLDYNTNLRKEPNTNAQIIAELPAGSVIDYDAFIKQGGLVWIRQPRQDGSYGYLATGEVDNSGNRTSTWGKFYGDE